MVIISGEQEKFGMITHINLAATSLFGFNKTELISNLNYEFLPNIILDRKINTLMSPLYAKHHDSFLERYLQTSESIIVGKNKERLAFGKAKSNYVFPFYYNVKAIPSMLEGVQFVATFRIEKKFKTIAYIITNPDGTIDSITSSCISLLKIDQGLLSKKPNIQDFVPNVISNKGSIFDGTENGHKAAAQVSFTFPRDSEYLLEGEGSSIQLSCSRNPLIFITGRESAGFQFKFEKIQEKAPNTSIVSKISNFQFRFEREKPAINGGYTGDLKTENQDQDIVDTITTPTGYDDRLMLTSEVLKPRHAADKLSEDLGVIKSMVYGIGIKTYKLYRGEIIDAEDEKSEEDDEEKENDNEHDRSSFENPKRGMIPTKEGGIGVSQSEDNIDEDPTTADFSSMAKSRKILNAVINDRTTPPHIKKLNICVHILCLILIGLSIWDYVNIIGNMDSIKINIDNVSQSRRLASDMMIALSDIRDLYLVNLGLFDNTYETALRSNLVDTLASAKVINELLTSDINSLSTSHQSLYNDPVVPLRYYQDSSVKQGLVQATNNIISTGLNVASMDLSNIVPDNADYYFLTINLFNEYYEALLESSALYLSEFYQNTSSSIKTFQAILILSTMILFLSLALLIPFVYSGTKSQDQVLRLFLDIPEKTVKSLYTKCENFVSNLQIGDEEEEIGSEMDADEMERQNEDPDAQGWLSKRRRKKFKNTRKSHKGFFFVFVILTLLLEAPFAYNFYASGVVMSKAKDITLEFNSTSMAELFIAFSNNVQRQLFINANLPIIDDSVLTVAARNVEIMRNLVSDLLSVRLLKSRY